MKSENINFDRVDNLTPVQQLLIKSCLATSKNEREAAVRDWEEQVIINDIDFSLSRLIPYFFHANQQHGITTRHDKRMKVIYKHWWLRSQHINHQLKIIHAAFTDAGIDTVVIKGASIKMYYERDELRPMADFDLLVDRADLKRAMQIIKDLDYLPDKLAEAFLQKKMKLFLDFGHSIPFVHQKSDAQIDLHWRIGSRCTTQFSDQLWLHLENYEAIPNARRPQLAYEVFMIIIHAVESQNRDNLNWIIDIAVINDKANCPFWEEARKLAVAEKKENLFDYGCSILIKLGVYAPDFGTAERPRILVPTTPEHRHQMNYIKLTFIRIANLFNSINYLFPHSNVFTKLYQFTRRVNVYIIARRLSRSIKP